MTYGCMETVRERRDQKIYNSTLLLGKVSFYSLRFPHVESAFVLRLLVIGKGLSVRTSSQKWHSWASGPALQATWGNAITGSRL